MLDWYLFSAVAAAGLLHGLSGMGFALIVIAALSGSVSLAQAIILVLMPTALLNLSAWLGGSRNPLFYAYFYLKKYWLLALLSLVFGILGAKLLIWVDQAYLLLLLSLIILWYSTTSLLGRAFILQNTRRNEILMGILGGIVGGATNAMAPVMMMYLLSISDNKEVIVRVSNLCFFLGKISQLIVLFPAFLALSSQEWQNIGMICLVSFVFMALGGYAQRFLPAARFRKLILILLLLLGLRLFYFSLKALLGF